MIDYKDVIKCPPLPFLGNKRNAIRYLYEYFRYKELEVDIIVDVFGGSGIVSNLFKQMYPEKKGYI